MTAARSLDVLALPLEGTTAIEASAGTGKTFTITKLYLRLLLEAGLLVEQILVVKFFVRGHGGGILQLDLTFCLFEARDAKLAAAHRGRFPTLGAQNDFVLVAFLFRMPNMRLRALHLSLTYFAKFFTFANVV